MNAKERQNNVIFNIKVIDEVVENLSKKKAFKALSENIRERYKTTGQFESAKIKKLCDETGIEREYFTGDKRFFISECEGVIEKNPQALDDIDANIPSFMSFIYTLVEAFKRGEPIEDENLERMIYYIQKDQSMEGYIRGRFDLRKFIVMMECIDYDKLVKLDRKILKEFIEFTSEKIILAQAAYITKKNDNKNKNKGL